MSDERILKVLAGHEEILNSHGEMLVRHEKILVRHENMLTDLRDNVVRRDEFNEFKNTVLTALDELMVILKRIEQEMTSVIAWQRRQDEQLALQAKEIELLRAV